MALSAPELNPPAITNCVCYSVPYYNNVCLIFQHNSYNQYYHNLVQASTAYFNGGTTPGGTTLHHQPSPRPTTAASHNYMGQLPPPLATTSTTHNKSQENLYTTRGGGSDNYAVHVRSSPISPANSGISVKNSSNYGPNNNTSFDYVPASAILGGQPAVLSNYRGGNVMDNYSVYVNGPAMQHGLKPGGSSMSSSSASPPSYHPLHQHEVVVPVHESGKTGSSSSGSTGGGSLATHV